MRNPFCKPHTAGQWLLGSLCWTTACISGWLLLEWAIVGYGRRIMAGNALEGVLASIPLTAHYLIWRQAIIGGWQLIDPAKPDSLLLLLAALAWLVVLVLFQVSCLVVAALLLVWTH